jgi:hypothetical protein
MKRILFAADLRWGSGSSHAVAEYVRVAGACDAEVKVASAIGSRDDQVSRLLPYENDLSWATHLVIVLEGNPFLDARSVEQIERAVPAHRRLVIDADGRSLRPVRVGLDDNFGPHGREVWAQQFELAGCPVLHPRLGPGGQPSFSYFGMPVPGPRMTQPCKLRYVGANWWRFDALVSVVRALRATDRRGRVEVCGRYWDGELRPGYEVATSSDAVVLDELGVQVHRPVPFGEVVSFMSGAVVSPVLLRPVLARLGLVTPRVFETIAARTIPLFLQGDTAISDVAGQADALHLGPDVAGDLGHILDDPVSHIAIADEFRAESYAAYRYERVLDRLLEQLS